MIIKINMIRLLFLASLAFTLCAVNGNRVAIAHLLSLSANGTITFTETEEGVRVTGLIQGLAAGNYGFHIHELGDTSTCAAAGGHYNPDSTNHGGPDHDERHVGDLGNVVFQANGVATIDFVDRLISLRDRNNVLGRSVVLHEGEDDLGLGGHADSLTTGNAGGRLACAVIGISPPLDAWTNAAGSIKPLLSLLASMFLIALSKY